jgi:DNA-binding ferritin-like protein
MRKNYKYLMILTFILNFTNIYSQSNNYIYTWYNESIGTLYIDKQLLESTANTLSQYLGPIAPIILEGLPYIISFFALFFIFRRFLNIINENLGIKNELAISMAIITTYYFWPFVIPILIIAFIIKVFRIGKSKLESFKENLDKINSGLKSIFSKAISYIKGFDKDTNKILKDINKLNKIISYPHIRKLLDSIKKDIENLNNILSQLLKETENEELTLDTLKDYSSKFNMIYNDAINKTKQINEIINPVLSNPFLLKKFGNIIFRKNKFTQEYSTELRNILNDLTERLNKVYKESLETFKYLNGLLTLAEADSRKYVIEIDNALKSNVNNNTLLSLGINNGAPIREFQKVENTAVAIYKNWRISPLKKVDILYETNKSTKKLSEFLHNLRKFRGNPKRLSNFINKYYKKTFKSIKIISKSITSGYRAFKAMKIK